MSFVRVVLVLLTLLPAIAGAANLRLTIASQPPSTGSISTRSVGNLSLNVASGKRVSFARQSGRDYRLQASGGFAWTQVQEVPQQMDGVAMTAELRDDGSVDVSVEVSRKDGARRQNYSSSITAQPGEWIQLYGPAESSSPDTQVYGTQRVSEDSLWLLVESLSR
ncbi:MAG: hypothetical protein AB8B57_01010 [Congregibacter sp.]